MGKIGLPFWSRYQDVHYNHPVDVGARLETCPSQAPPYPRDVWFMRLEMYKWNWAHPWCLRKLHDQTSWGWDFFWTKNNYIFKGKLLRRHTGLNWPHVFSPRKLYFTKYVVVCECVCFLPSEYHRQTTCSSCSPVELLKSNDVVVWMGLVSPMILRLQNN